MVVVRLSKSGSTHRPFYHVVVTDSRARRDSRYIERIGFLNYFAAENEKVFDLNEERLNYWVGQGAILRPSVNKLVKRQKREAQLVAEGKRLKGDGKEVQESTPAAKETAPAAPAAPPPAQAAENDGGEAKSMAPAPAAIPLEDGPAEEAARETKASTPAVKDPAPEAPAMEAPEQAVKEQAAEGEIGEGKSAAPAPAVSSPELEKAVAPAKEKKAGAEQSELAAKADDKEAE